MEAIRKIVQANAVKTKRIIEIIEKSEICPACNGSGLSVLVRRAVWPGGKVEEKESVSVCKTCKGKRIL